MCDGEFEFPLTSNAGVLGDGSPNQEAIRIIAEMVQLACRCTECGGTPPEHELLSHFNSPHVEPLVCESCRSGAEEALK